MLKGTKALLTNRDLFNRSVKRFSDVAKLNYLSYVENPTAPNLVVLHGLMGNSMNFRSIVTHNELKGLCNSYVFDLRNHGKSEHKPTMSYEEMAADIDAATSELGLDKFYLLGHSLGGKVAMVYSRLYAERLKGLIVCDIGPFNYNDTTKFKSSSEIRALLQACAKINLTGTTREKLKVELENAANGKKDISGLLLTNIEQITNGNYKWRVNLEAIINFYGQIMDPFSHSSKKYNGPVKVIAGGKSEYVPKDRLSEYNTIFENFDIQRDVTYIEPASHWVHFTHPEEFVKEVSAFIKQHEH